MIGMSLVIPHAHKHGVLGKIILGYSRSTLSSVTCSASPRQVAQTNLHVPQWVMKTLDLQIP